MGYIIENQEVNSYYGRCITRQTQLMTATINLRDYFIALGDTKTIADSKVTDLSTELASSLYAYVLGNNNPITNGINNSMLPFMDAETKEFTINELIYPQ